ncbi:MAG: acyl-CoA reductase [Sphingobacteriia bacterium]|nr:MAG: acyl-CoA reductase [Sphingobacteriia bacterium]
MILQERIEILSKLKEYLSGNDAEWTAIKERAYRENQWFIPAFIEAAVNNIATHFLNKEILQKWADQYQITSQLKDPKNIGIVMAGNIPLVGFHDLLCVFMSGHIAVIKPSSKDEILIKHIAAKLYEWDVSIQNHISFAERLNNCDAYIATGSNNSSRYFEQYFGKYPHIIRKNRTSVAVLDGKESIDQLEALADDAMLFFGLGCRNVTQLLVPKNYDFIPLLNALKKYEGFMEYHKYKHNFDYHLALLIMGGKYYMNNDSVILTINESPFSPVSQINYFAYENETDLKELLNKNDMIQCIVGNGYTPFGMAQQPGINDYADGIDTMAFLSALSN